MDKECLRKSSNYIMTLEEQIANKCIHFNGVSSKTCKAGINYNDVWVKDVPLGLPCLKKAGHCDKCQFPTEDEVKKRIWELEGLGQKGLIAWALVKDRYKTNKEPQGVVQCQCGGELHYQVAQNNHIRAYCKSCGISLME